MITKTIISASVIFCILILSACNLAQESPEITATQTNTITPFATINTATMTHTATIVPSTQTATATNPTSTQIPTQNEQVDCVVSQVNLPIYIVQVGDTLSNIATRAASTVSRLAELNCLSNASHILVGQQLIVPNAITTSSSDEDSQSDASSSNDSQLEASNNDTAAINLDNIPYPPTNNQGNLVLSDWNLNVAQNYIVETGDTFTFTWQMPDSMEFIQVGFVAQQYRHDSRGPRTLFGVDTDLTNGASIQWLAPSDTQTYIFAVGQIAGQSELVVSQIIKIGTEDSNQAFEVGSAGYFVVSPVIGEYQASPHMIENESLITLSWLGMDVSLIGYRLADVVYFYYEDEVGNTILIGQDDDDSDGISTTWQTPSNISGSIYAEAIFMGNDVRRYPTISGVIQIQSSIED